MYKLPLKNCLITSHKSPDGDALSSCIAVYNYLISNGCRAAIRLVGNIPKNLDWMLENITIINYVPKWVEKVIVLDCAPTLERVGWKIPGGLKILNIDHHDSRINEHDPKQKIFVFKSCSTAAILFNHFGIKDDILAIGAYTDTYFIKNIQEVAKFISDLKISEEKIEEYVEKINYKSDKRTWKIIRDSKIHRYKNGFVIVETDEYDMTAIETAMHILCELNETVCLIYGDKDVKLRTSDKGMDLSLIAKEFGGGGHKFASACNVKGKVSEFKEFISHLK